MPHVRPTPSPATPTALARASLAGLLGLRGLLLLPGLLPGLLLGAPLLLAACGSTSAGLRSGTEDGEPAVRITLRDFVSGRRFELVNPNHSDPVDYYSRSRRDASRKIVAGSIVTALLEYLEDGGFEEHGQSGSLPGGPQSARRGFEIEGPGGRAHWLVTDASPADERLAMNDCAQAFFQTYNAITSYQSIDNERGSRYFERAEAEARATGGRR